LENNSWKLKTVLSYDHGQEWLTLYFD
jgi:hypothetical protein